MKNWNFHQYTYSALPQLMIVDGGEAQSLVFAPVLPAPSWVWSDIRAGGAQ